MYIGMLIGFAEIMQYLFLWIVVLFCIHAGTSHSDVVDSVCACFSHGFSLTVAVDTLGDPV